MAQISLVVVDGQCTFADALASRLAEEEGLQVVATADSAAATRRLLVGRNVDVVLLDSALPDALPFATELARAGAISPHGIRVIMLGTVPTAAGIVEALRLGVSGWVSKADSIEWLLDAIRSAMRGETWLPPPATGPVLKFLLAEHDQQQAGQSPALAGLTVRERQVLAYLAEGLGRREVAERLNLSANTVRSHLQNLMGKLNVHSSLEAVALARRADLRERPSEPQPHASGASRHPR